MVFRDWYTSPQIPYPWSCNWAHWEGTPKWLRHPGYPRPSIEDEFNGPYHLPAPLEPLIFWDGEGYGDWDHFTFVCDGTYYLYDDYRQSIRRYHGTYASPTAFLRAQLPTFEVEPPVSARYKELTERCAWWHKEHYPWCYGEDRWELQAWKQLNEDLDWEFKHPPPNDVYTEIFPEKDKLEIVAPKSTQ